MPVASEEEGDINVRREIHQISDSSVVLKMAEHFPIVVLTRVTFSVVQIPLGGFVNRRPKSDRVAEFAVKTGANLGVSFGFTAEDVIAV